MQTKWSNSSGKFGKISTSVDKLLTAKYNIEKVVAILRDYENLEEEVEDLTNKLDDNESGCSEVFTVYKKLKMMNFVRQKLIEKIKLSDSNNRLDLQESSAEAKQKIDKINEKF